MRRFILFVTALCLSLSGFGQRYSFKYIHSSDEFNINSNGDQVYCLFRVKGSTSKVTYRKVFLTENLVPTDSTEYEFDGDPFLIASGDNSFYTYHAFENKINGVQMIQFLITGKSGEIVYEFQKIAADFVPVFGKEVKPRNISLNLLSDNNKDIMLVEVIETNGRFHPRLNAWDIRTGAILWQSDVTSLGMIRTTESSVIGLTQIDSPGRPALSVHVFDKETGKRNSFPLRQTTNQRSIDVLASNGNQIMIAGAEYQGNNTKNSRLYMSMFEMGGNMLFDRLDSAERLEKYRRHLLGSTFDKDGNLVLIGEGYKIDATRVVVTIAASIAFSAILGGGVISTGAPDNRIDFISSAVFSTATGEVRNFRNFPVGPWYDFAKFYSAGDRVLIGVKNKFLLYNVDEPAVPPSQFASLKLRDQLLLTPFGPAVTYRETSKSRIVIELVSPDTEPTKN